MPLFCARLGAARSALADLIPWLHGGSPMSLTLLLVLTHSAWRRAARRTSARRCCGPSPHTCCTQRRTCSAGMIGDSSRDAAPNCCLLCRSLSLRLTQLACCVLQLTALVVLPFNVHQVLQSELPDGLGLFRAAALGPSVSPFCLLHCRVRLFLCSRVNRCCSLRGALQLLLVDACVNEWLT